jgi:predicted dienelactone hydrolase
MPFDLHKLVRGTVLAVLGPAACAAALAPAPRFHAGETARAAKTASAALRNHGDPTLRLLVWYPAPASAAEKPLPGGKAFAPGQAATAAPWADAARHPVVLLSHGFGGAGRQMTWLGTALARAGYVAIAVDHPGTNGVDGITPEGAYAPWERAGDLAAALDFALADPALAPHLDAARIGVAGFSMGGFTGALLVGARADLAAFNAFCAGPARDAICDRQQEFPLDYREAAGVLAAPALAPIAAREHADLADARVRAAFLIDPALVPALDQNSLANVRVPVAVLYGTADPIAPPTSNAMPLLHGIADAQAIALPGVGHYDFLSECGPAGAKVAPAYCGGNPGARAQTHATTVAAMLRFFGPLIGPR